MKSRLGFLVPLALMLAVSPAAWAADFDVTITNLTQLQTFTPLLVASHSDEASLFEPGSPASAELALVAEAGDIAPLEALLHASGEVRDTNTNGALLGPGESVTITVEAGGGERYISLVGMLIPTNDTFVAVRSLPIPRGRGVASRMALAWDAGTEANDQNCANIPGPRCRGVGPSEPSEDDEGFIHVSNGFHDRGDYDKDGNEILGPQAYDWRNPVARIVVQRAESDDSELDD